MESEGFLCAGNSVFLLISTGMETLSNEEDFRLIFDQRLGQISVSLMAL